jgi:formate-dependent nitrite reductase membrane component NrfD
VATIAKQLSIFQQEWTGKGERGMRDFLLIPAIFFGAVSPGLFISSLLTNYIYGYWIALVMNFIGYGMTHLLFLGRMKRFWRAVLNWKTSWISRGFLFNAFFSGFGFLYALSVSAAIPVLSNPSIKTVLMLLSAVSAMLFMAYPGFMLSIVKAIPFWRSVLEPIIFCLQGLLGGIALQIIVMTFTPADLSVSPTLVKMNFALVVMLLLLFVRALIIKALHGGAGKVSVEFLTTGDFSFIFLGGAMVIGLVTPAFILIAGVFYPLDFAGYGFLYYIAAMGMELIGIYLSKYSILRAGAYSPIT